VPVRTLNGMIFEEKIVLEEYLCDAFCEEKQAWA
jgi:hypothetical protein